MEKEIVIFSSGGKSGNIFYILMLVQNALRKQRRIIDYNECRERVCRATNYQNALEIIREYVDLIDIDGRY